MRSFIHGFCEKKCVKLFSALKSHRRSSVPYADDPNAYESDREYLKLRKKLLFWSRLEFALRRK